MKIKRNRPAVPQPSGGKPARGGGLGMGGNNPNQLMSQMQKLQDEMAKTQAALEEEEVTASVGGGVVTVVATGGQAIRSITIKPEANSPISPAQAPRWRVQALEFLDVPHFLSCKSVDRPQDAFRIHWLAPRELLKRGPRSRLPNHHSLHKPISLFTSS